MMSWDWKRITARKCVNLDMKRQRLILISILTSLIGEYEKITLKSVFFKNQPAINLYISFLWP